MAIIALILANHAGLAVAVIDRPSIFQAADRGARLCSARGGHAVR